MGTGAEVYGEVGGLRGSAVSSYCRMTKSILVVDDDAAIARLYATALGSLGEVQVAESGLAAVAMLAVRSFDAVILDLRMPGMGGLDVLDKAFSEGKHAGTAVFVVTADQSDEMRMSALKRGAVFQFTKPVPLRVLVEQVRSQLERKRSLKP